MTEMLVEPKVSVIIPVYNSEKYLEQCLDSVMGQTYSNIEIICIDDCSNDTSLKILQNYQVKDNRMVILRQFANSGPSVARNRGLEAASGKYVLFVDSDDMVATNLLQDVVPYAENFELDEILFDCEVFTDVQEWKWRYKRKETPKVIISSLKNGREVFAEREELSGAFRASWTSLYSCAYLKRNNLRFYEGILHEDVLFYYKRCMCAERVMCINLVLYYYRKNPERITTSWKENRARSVFTVIMEIFADWTMHNYGNRVDKAIKSVLTSMWYVYRKAQFSGEISSNSADNRPAVDFMYRFMNNMLPNKYISNFDVDKLKKFDKIIVYGCGNYAVEVIDRLAGYKISPSHIIVSHKNGNPKTFVGLPVQTLAEIGFIENAVVVLAMSPEFQEGVKEELRSVGYRKIYEVS